MRRGSFGDEGGAERSSWISVEEEAETGRVIAAALTVHRELGPGFSESIYHSALECEFRNRKVSHATEVVVQVCYQGVPVGSHRLDLVAGMGIVVELKAVLALERVHFAQLRSYLKASGKPIGLLLNFGQPRLVVRRIVLRLPLRIDHSALP